MGGDRNRHRDRRGSWRRSHRQRRIRRTLQCAAVRSCGTRVHRRAAMARRDSDDRNSRDGATHKRRRGLWGSDLYRDRCVACSDRNRRSYAGWYRASAALSSASLVTRAKHDVLWHRYATETESAGTAWPSRSSRSDSVLGSTGITEIVGHAVESAARRSPAAAPGDPTMTALIGGSIASITAEAYEAAKAP